MPTVCSASTQKPSSTPRYAWLRPAYLLAISLAAFALLGYHPYAEDGGIYASALSLRLDPALFPAFRAFAVAHTGKSLFIPLLTALIRGTHLPQDAALLLCHLLAVIATVFAADRLARTFFLRPQTRLRSVLLFSAALGMPVAGTSLYLADPYLTARSFSTPLVLFTLFFVLQRRLWPAALCLVAAFAMHPLMGAWALLPVAFLLVWQRSRRPVVASGALGCAALVGMAALQWLLPRESPAVRAAALSRGYWFLSDWQWFEWIGLFGPLLLLLLFAVKGGTPDRFRTEARIAAAAASACIVTVWIASTLLVHTSNANFFLTRTQPLRLLHTTSAIFVLLLGGWLAEISQSRMRWIFPVCLVAAAAGMVVAQRSTYTHSGYWELPGASSPNGYVNAFRWLRSHTPETAVIAADARYTTATGEDAQMIRAISLRSSVPDAAKDGGIASVLPSLAETWQTDSALQQNLSRLSDAQRLSRLQTTGATWLLLPASADTQLRCPYANADAKVCALP